MLNYIVKTFTRSFIYQITKIFLPLICLILGFLAGRNFDFILSYLNNL